MSFMLVVDILHSEEDGIEAFRVAQEAYAKKDIEKYMEEQRMAPFDGEQPVTPKPSEHAAEGLVAAEELDQKVLEGEGSSPPKHELGGTRAQGKRGQSDASSSQRDPSQG